MRKSISKLAYLLGLFLIVGLVACEGPEGPQGPAGQDGVDGVDGTDGQDGADGLDGNANVVMVTLSSGDIVWTSGTFLGRTANTFSFTEEAVTQDIIDHGTVLGYCFISSQWWAMPFTWMNTGGTLIQTVIHSYALNTISLWAYDTNGVLNPGGITQYRFLLITDNTVMTKSTESEKSILEKLEDAGVNVDDYYSVMDYFGLEY